LVFHVLPTWRHTIRIEAVDDASRTLRTQEQGGLLKTWNHTIQVEPHAAGCRYVDRVEMQAAALTPIAGLIAKMFFRYRQRRLRRLVAQS
jgi:ligand-binding SRPBCC domain-containing protein